ncbi:glycoside hydrolase family 105 protein [Plicaturopsis crispa FD-325 SS-3]|nr:glycoside hydrolase family 105 protein [Plicaturopsis crispa FD-325 SS-3]
MLPPTLLTLTLLSLCTSPAFAGAPNGSYAIWAADSAISRGQGNGLSSAGVPSVSYEHGELWWGLQQLYARGGNATYHEYIEAGVANIVFDNGTVHGGYNASAFALDPIRTGPTILYLYDETGDVKYKTAADQFREQFKGHPRTAQGQFWHKLIYPNEGWLDGIYMGDVFYAQYTRDFEPDNTTAWDDIALQFRLMYTNTLQNASAPNSTGLLYHGYDYSHTAVWASPDRGHSPEVWDRALGWFLMALVDVLPILPPSYTPEFLGMLRTLAPRAVKAADKETGVWWLVETQPGRAGNYFESSGSAMVVYALLRAVRLGYVSDRDGGVVGAMRKAYGYMVDNWVVDNGNGTMGWTNTVVVGSLDTAGDFDYYISEPTDLNDLKGLAAFLLASLEYEALPPA